MYNFKVFCVIIATSFLFFSCSPETERGSANATQQPATQQLSQNQKFEIVPNDKVCMVNDRFMGIDQIPIEVDGITYYGCCQDCVKKIQENLGGVRYSTDPVSGEKVDKAAAVIVRNKADGAVFYFRSDVSASQFLKQQKS